MTKVIVFGPTGSVGSHVARTAQEHGAKVYLAMRDTSKAIRGLSAEQEKQGGFERVTADLTKEETCAAVVKETGAKRAFIYLMHQSKDHMESTLRALKSAGLETVVFLSSYTVTKAPEEVAPEELIPYFHARVEMALESVFGAKNYVAIRPGAFATNSSAWWKNGIKAGEVKMFCENVKFDWTPAEDMGGVAGAILANGTQEKIVYVFGPQYISFKEAFEIVQREALTKPVKLTILDTEAQSVEFFTSQGAPPPIAKYLSHVLASRASGEADDGFKHLKEGQQNVQKYLSRPGIQFQDWVRQHKEEFE